MQDEPGPQPEEAVLPAVLDQCTHGGGPLCDWSIGASAVSRVKKFGGAGPGYPPAYVFVPVAVYLIVVGSHTSQPDSLCVRVVRARSRLVV